MFSKRHFSSTFGKKSQDNRLKNYHFLPQIIVRTPNWPIEGAFSEESIREVIKNPAFLEAIYISSPNLFEALKKMNEGSEKNEKNIANSLYAAAKYYIRSKHRCTPFGLFSGVGLARWGDSTDLKLLSGVKRHTRLDMNYICSLIQNLEIIPELRSQLFYTVNSSLYKRNTEYRFLEYSYVGNERQYQISSIERNEIIEEVLIASENGCSFIGLVKLVSEKGFETGEASGFIQSLIETQLLESELSPAVTGSEPLISLIHKLEKKDLTVCPDAERILDILKVVKEELKKLDVHRSGFSGYETIKRLLGELGIHFDQKSLYQVTSMHPLKESSSLDKEVQVQLSNSVEKLYRLSGGTHQNPLASFKSKFYAKYEQQAVPLLEVMDFEVGLGYGEESNSYYAPLIENIVWPFADSEESLMNLSKQDKVKLKRLMEALRNDEYEIEIDSLLESFREVEIDLNPSSSVMFRLLSDQKILFEFIGGTSGVNLLSRFATSDESINEFVREITEKEQSNNPEVIFAEITHLPQENSGNILFRPIMRPMEINYLSGSEINNESRIKLSDLWVSVKNDRIQLYDKKRESLIVPRLSSAHNYSQRSLPIYKFLCDLQSQEQPNGLKFDWGSLSKLFAFLPRVTNGNVILSRAQWNLNTKDIQAIGKLKTAKEFETWRSSRSLPSEFLIIRGDNELYISSEEAFMFELFKEEIKKKTEVVLVEFLCQRKAGLVNEKGEAYANQIVATLMRDTAIDYGKELPVSVKHVVKRSFELGSEWVYIKLYCGEKKADELLQLVINEMIQEAYASNVLKNWFFLRYADPENHLRLRFRLNQISDLGAFIALLNSKLEWFKTQKIISEIQYGTYNRELERYGSENIETVEKIFHLDSTLCLSLLSRYSGDELEELRWLWSLKLLDKYLDLFGLTLEAKWQLTERVRASLNQEFYGDQSLKTQIDKLYRLHRAQIETYQNSKETELDDLFEGFEPHLRSLINHLNLDAKSEQKDFKLITGILHMSVNRLVKSEPRKHEFVIYDFLARHYKSSLARRG